jgi:dienelactone hydrolase
LETFDRALGWLTAQPEAPPGRLAVMGTSKGAEAAPLIALRHPELSAVIAAAPSSAVWPGINWDSVNGLNAGSSWTSGGEPLPYVPYASFHPAVLIGNLGRLYRNAPERVAEHPAGAIPIENVRAPALLICGELDRLWPACPMARQLDARAEAAGGPQITVLSLALVGHADLEPPYPDPAVGPTPRWGGTAEDANKARARSWDAIVEFLEENVAGGAMPAPP